MVGAVDTGAVVVGCGVAGAGCAVTCDETQPSEAGHKAGGGGDGAVVHLGDASVVHAAGQGFRRDAGGHVFAVGVQNIVARQAARTAGDAGDVQAIDDDPVGGADIAAVVAAAGVGHRGRVVTGHQARPGVGRRKTAGCRCAAVIHLGHIGVAEGRRDGFARDAGRCSLARCQAVVGGQAAVAAVGQAGGVDRHQVGGVDVLAVVTGCPCGGHGFRAHQTIGDAQHGGGRIGAVIGFARGGCRGREGLGRDGGCHGFGRGVQLIVGQGAAVAAGDAACQGQAIDGHRRGRDHVFAVVARAGVGQYRSGIARNEARPGVAGCEARRRVGAAVIHLGDPGVAHGRCQGFGGDGGRHGFAVRVQRIVAGQAAVAAHDAGERHAAHRDLIGQGHPWAVVGHPAVDHRSTSVACHQARPGVGGCKACGRRVSAVIDLAHARVADVGDDGFRRDAGRHGFAGGVEHIVRRQAAVAAGDARDGQAIHGELVGGADVLAVVAGGRAAERGGAVTRDQTGPAVGGGEACGCGGAGVIHLGHTGVREGWGQGGWSDGGRDGFAGAVQLVVGGGSAVAAGDRGDGQATDRDLVRRADVFGVVSRGGVAQGGGGVATDESRPAVAGREAAGGCCGGVVFLGDTGVGEGGCQRFRCDDAGIVGVVSDGVVAVHHLARAAVVADHQVRGIHRFAGACAGAGIGQVAGRDGVRGAQAAAGRYGRQQGVEGGDRRRDGGAAVVNFGDGGGIDGNGACRDAGRNGLARCQTVVAGHAIVRAIDQGGGVHRHQVGGGYIFRVEGGCAGGCHCF